MSAISSRSLQRMLVLRHSHPRSAIFGSSCSLIPRNYHSDMDVEIPAIAETSPHTLRVLSHRQYDTHTALSPSSVHPNPLEQFRLWFTATQGNVDEPEAMALATTSKEGVPSVRMVLLKQVDDIGFVFYTNYGSRKAREMDEMRSAALAFYWREMHRQVRVVGRVEKVTRQETEEYFRSRPVGSRLGAWASRQSTVVADGEVEKQLEEVKERFGVKGDEVDAEVPVPEFWGGWRVVPTEVEFWAGKPSRLHDRVRYLRVEGSTSDAPRWTIDRLAP